MPRVLQIPLLLRGSISAFYPLDEEAVLGQRALLVFDISVSEHVAHHLIESTALFIREIKKNGVAIVGPI